jgi:acyl-CoA reductase-like NAD-dependent aldehyde dehydrogenase
VWITYEHPTSSQYIYATLDPFLPVVQGRARMMHRLADLMEANLANLALLETLDSGKPLQQSFTKEIPLAIDNVRYFAG